jgi:hypothetical protein
LDHYLFFFVFTSVSAEDHPSSIITVSSFCLLIMHVRINVWKNIGCGFDPYPWLIWTLLSSIDLHASLSIFFLNSYAGYSLFL